MRILLLTDNYWPETNAPALRSGAHARRWVEQGEDVTVVTSFPNFPEGKLFKGYRQRFRERRMIDTVDVIRVPTLIFPNAGTLKRILDFMSYMVSASIAGFFVRRPDVVVATSPQFFAAVAGWLVAAVRRRPFVFELRDLWPDSIVAVGAMPDSLPIRLLRRLEHFLYRRADLIVTVTHAFRDNLIGRGIDLICAMDPLLQAFRCRPRRLRLLGRRGTRVGLLGSLCRRQGGARNARAHLCGGDRNNECPRQSFHTGADPYPYARAGVPGRGPDDAGNAGQGCGQHRRLVPAEHAGERQALRLS